MAVLTLASSKGGSARTTTARCILGAMARAEADIVAVDSDPTEALHRWSISVYEGKPFKCYLETNEDKLALLIGKLRREHATVLVDTAGFANLSASVAIASADAVLVPCAMSEPDLVEARTTALKVEALAASTRRDIPARLLLNRVRSTAVSQHAERLITEAGLPRLKTTFGMRTEYEAVSYAGKAPSTGPAYREILELVVELQALGWL